MPNEPKATILDGRLWSAVLGISMILGSWWLQNQYNLLLSLQDQVREVLIFVDGKYVDKELLETIAREQDKRLDRIDRTLTDISRQLSEINRPAPPHGQ